MNQESYDMEKTLTIYDGQTAYSPIFHQYYRGIIRLVEVAYQKYDKIYVVSYSKTLEYMHKCTNVPFIDVPVNKHNFGLLGTKYITPSSASMLFQNVDVQDVIVYLRCDSSEYLTYTIRKCKDYKPAKLPLNQFFDILILANIVKELVLRTKTNNMTVKLWDPISIKWIPFMKYYNKDLKIKVENFLDENLSAKLEKPLKQAIGWNKDEIEVNARKFYEFDYEMRLHAPTDNKKSLNFVFSGQFTPLRQHTFHILDQLFDDPEHKIRFYATVKKPGEKLKKTFIPVDQYYKLLKASKFTFNMLPFVKTTVSQSRFTEAMFRDCISIFDEKVNIHKLFTDENDLKFIQDNLVYHPSQYATINDFIMTLIDRYDELLVGMKNTELWKRTINISQKDILANLDYDGDDVVY